MINKISGKRSPTEIKHLQVGDKEVTTVADIADTVAESFSEISSNKHYSSKFQSHQVCAERQNLKFNSHNTETYNIPFCIDELLSNSRNRSQSAITVEPVQRETEAGHNQKHSPKPTGSGFLHQQVSFVFDTIVCFFVFTLSLFHL